MIPRNPLTTPYFENGRRILIIFELDGLGQELIFKGFATENGGYFRSNQRWNSLSEARRELRREYEL